MQYKQKNFLFTALVAVMGFALVTSTGCDGNDDNKDKDAGKTKDVDVMTVGKLAKSADFINADEVDRVVVSGDGNWAYFTATKGATLHAANIGGAKDFAKNIADKGKWATVQYKATGLGGTAGKAELTDANKVTFVSPTTDGALVSVTAATTDHNGVAYFKGKTVTFAWGSSATDLGKITPKNELFGFAVKIDNADIPYVFDAATFIGTTHGKLEAAKLDLKVSRGTHPFTSVPMLAYDDKNAYAVAVEGLSTMAKASIGTKADFSDVEKATPKVGSALWKQDAGVNNESVNGVVAVNGNVYIALGSNGATDHTGGVAVYNVATPGTKAPAGKSWNKVNVIGFAVDGTKVYAVTAKGLVEVNAAGAAVEAGAKIDQASAKKDGYEGESFPADHITGAAFVGKNMIVTTSDAGVYTVAATKKQVKEKQD